MLVKSLLRKWLDVKPEVIEKTIYVSSKIEDQEVAPQEDIEGLLNHIYHTTDITSTMLDYSLGTGDLDSGHWEGMFPWFLRMFSNEDLSELMEDSLAKILWSRLTG